MAGNDPLCFHVHRGLWFFDWQPGEVLAAFKKNCDIYEISSIL